MKIITNTVQQKSLDLHITDTGTGEVYIVVTDRNTGIGSLKVTNTYAAITAELVSKNLAIVHERVFGSLAAEPALRAVRTEALSAAGMSTETPLTYIEGSPKQANGLNGIIIRAVTCNDPDDVWTIYDDHVPCGRGWRRGNSSFLTMQNLHGHRSGPDSVNTPPIQTLRMLEQAKHLLQQQGACFQDVIRTWFYLDDILSWYDEFNKVRSSKYRDLGIMPGPGKELMLPASTGIRGRNSSGASGALDLFAITGLKDSRPAIEKLSSTAQKDAFCYGSAFSRGALVQDGETSSLQISGTAAIDEQGMSLYPDDIKSQISCTFDKVEELLDQAEGKLSDICAATVFVKKTDFIPVFWEMAAERGLENFPAVCVVADICREELLFEIDAESNITG